MLAVCFVFAAMGVLILLDGDRSFLAWAGILFFGGGGLFVLFLILRERITHTPYYSIELQKFEDASKAGRAVRRFNKSVAGSQETLPADGLTIKPKDLCEILNERVKDSRNI